MKRVILSGILILNMGLIADELDEIVIVDESQKSSLYQKEEDIVGCDDTVKKEELTCAKEPKAAILSKLPSSQQLSEETLKDDDKKEEIAQQLKTILAELNKLKKEQQADRATIRELKEVISVLSKKKSTNKKEEATIVKQSIQKIAKKETKQHKATKIRKPIKELYRTDSEAIVEVQNNESLSTYAQYYYGDNKLYYKIYKANKDKINSNLQLIIGQQLVIPLQ